jgi:hypothetical protein
MTGLLIILQDKDLQGTVNMDQIKLHYFTSHPDLNKWYIIPKGVNFEGKLNLEHKQDAVGCWLFMIKEEETIDVLKCIRDGFESCLSNHECTMGYKIKVNLNCRQFTLKQGCQYFQFQMNIKKMYIH